MAPFQIVLKRNGDDSDGFLWSLTYHGNKGRRINLTLLSYHIRWKDGTNQNYPQCPLRIDFSSPPDMAPKIRTLMFGDNKDQSGGTPEWNRTRYNNDNLGFFIPNGEHGGDQHPAFTSCNYAPMEWSVDLLDDDVFTSLTLDTNAPWQSTNPDDPGTQCHDICGNIEYVILNFDVRPVGFCNV